MKPPTQEQVAALPEWARPLVIAQLRHLFEERNRQIRVFINVALRKAVHARRARIAHPSHGLVSQIYETEVYICDDTVRREILNATRKKFRCSYQIGDDGTISTEPLKWLLLEEQDFGRYMVERFGIDIARSKGEAAIYQRMHPRSIVSLERSHGARS
jgi:hypothetical protein